MLYLRAIAHGKVGGSGGIPPEKFRLLGSLRSHSVKQDDELFLLLMLIVKFQFLIFCVD